MTDDKIDKESFARELSLIDFDDFQLLFEAEDAFTLVIRGTIIVENQLIKLIEENLVNPSAIEDMRLDFYGRASLAAALGLRQSLKPPIRALGGLRNKFAHRLDAVLGEQEVNGFYKSFASVDKRIIETVHRNASQNFRDTIPEKLKDWTPKDRVAIFIITLRGALVSARAEASAARNRTIEGHR